MKLCTYASSQGPRLGVVCNDRVFDGQTSRALSDIIADWPNARPALEAAVKHGEGIPPCVCQTPCTHSEAGKNLCHRT